LAGAVILQVGKRDLVDYQPRNSGDLFEPGATQLRRKRMAEAVPALTRHDLEAKIVKRCWKDEEFRKEFLADPAGAFVTYLNVPLASLRKIVIHQEEPGSWHIVLPVKPASSGELSEEELEVVAGGVSTVSCVSLTIVTAATVTMSVATISVDKGW
jgi:hypothetical protein